MASLDIGDSKTNHSTSLKRRKMNSVSVVKIPIINSDDVMHGVGGVGSDRGVHGVGGDRGVHGVGSDRSQMVSTSGSRGTLFLIMCFFGIFISYLVYGIVQEKITKRKFGDEYFRFFLFLVLVQCLINASFARIVCSVKKWEVSLLPHGVFSFLAFTYVGAMVSSNSALSYISYPTQVLGKSAKPIPILIMGVLFGGKHYPRIKYFIVLLIVMGVGLFLYKEGRGQTMEQNEAYKIFDLIGFGEGLLIVSLTLDGVTGMLQDELRAKHEVSAHHMMFAVNAFSSIYLSIAVIATGELWRALDFIQNHPEVLITIGAFSVSSAVGQNFIFLTVTNFGPLTTSIITTTRKFFTILASIVIFMNPILPRQWLGVCFVFLGLGIDAYYGRATKK